MAKVLLHFIVLALLFFGVWFLLSRIDFVNIFEIEQLTKDTEEKLSAWVLKEMQRGKPELGSDSVQAFVEDIKQRLCEANGIDESSIFLYILLERDINAFTLPGRNLVLYSGLISYCNSPEELAGVLAHEIAHMEHEHVKKKLLKEVGLSMLTTIAGGDASGEIGRQVMKLLTSTAFDREQENEADLWAVRCLAKAHIDPEHLANFLFRLSREKGSIPRQYELLITHPNSQDRAAEILNLRKRETYEPAPISDPGRWRAMKGLTGSFEERK
ncbi:MAG: M48 family metallopeptidase [Ignavibacteriales bacterium]|nr:M48 family metallopeptidase [Ignavibacteriales bacterium]